MEENNKITLTTNDMDELTLAVKERLNHDGELDSLITHIIKGFMTEEIYNADTYTEMAAQMLFRLKMVCRLHGNVEVVEE